MVLFDGSEAFKGVGAPSLKTEVSGKCFFRSGIFMKSFTSQ
jgi:hypothetical protein